jgi:F-type H+-transporting ATPase subunit b
MRKFALFLIILLVPMFLLAQPASNASGDAAHGAEKQAHEVAHPDENHGEGHKAPETYFGIPGWILKLVNMIAFIAVLGWLVGGPVKTAFAARGEQIRRAADEAREHRAKADQLAGDIQARLTQIQQEVIAIRERAEQEGVRQKQELIAAAETEAAKILASARAEVDNRVKHARHELTEYAGQLASDRAEAILRQAITEKDQHKLFEESLQEVGEVRS